MSTKGIVVTGIGIISPFGIGKDCFWNGLKTGKSCIKEITCFDVTDLKSKKAAMVPDYRPEDYDDSFRFCRASKSSQFTLIAADMAIKDAGLKLDRVSPHKIGIFIGSGHCALECTEKFYSVLLEKGTTLTNPLLFQQTVSNAPASEISIKYGIKGPSYVITSGNASGGLAISVAILNLKKGYIDIAIAGGVDTHFKLIHEAFMHLRHLSPKDGGEEICRPFDKKRNGIICGEGVGLIVIETIEHAIKRDAKILAEIVGDGASYDSLKASPHSKERSIAFAMMEAIKEAGLNKDEIEYIVSTANSSDVIDVNLNGPFYVCKAVRKQMAAQKSGKIVNIASVTGLIGQELRTNYGASKGALIALTKSIARELAPFGIQVNAVAPQIVEGGLSLQASKKFITETAKFTPLGRIGKGIDVANAALFLSSDLSDFITGEVIYVTGGLFTHQI